MHATEDVNRGLSDPADALQRVNDVLRLMRSIVWESDRDGVFTYVSPSLEDVLGYRPEEVVGVRRIGDFYPPDLSPKVRAGISPRSATEAREFTNVEVPLLAKSGEIVWVASDGKPVFDENGNLAGFRGADTDITPRKKFEDNLVSREAQLMDLIRAAPVPMAYTLVSGQGEMIVNKAFEQLFGYTSKEVTTMEEWFRRAYPDQNYRDEVRRRIAKLMKSITAGPPHSDSEAFRITCKDGRVFEVEVAAAIVGGCFVGTFVDMTARQRTLEQTRAAESELRGILDNLPFPVAMSAAGPDFDWTDARAKVLYLNGRFTALFGYELADIPTVAEWARVAFPGESERLAIMAGLDAQVKLALAGERDVGPVAAETKAKDGRKLDVIIKAVAVGGNLVIAFEDMTERNRARGLLEESEMRLLGVIANTPVPVAYTTGGGREMRMNKAFTDAFGWGERDLPTVEVWFEKAYPDPNYRSEVFATWNADVEKALRKDGKIRSRLYRVTAKNGELRDVEITAAIFEGEMFGTFLDLTERNRAERQLREQRDQIAHSGRVSALGQLAASLAHELDQPLGAILNNAEAARLILAKKKPSTSELLEILDDIVEDDRRAGDVLDRIRAMVQKEPFRAEAVEVAQLFSETLNLVQAAAAKKGIKLESSCEPGLLRVEGDRILLQQALLNLVLNSIDAIGARRDGIISLRAGEADAGRVGISVSDNGGGLPHEDTTRFLQPFQTTKQGGLGMGLPIVNSIVEQHGGSLRVDNQPGRGLSVSLILPGWHGGAR